MSCLATPRSSCRTARALPGPVHPLELALGPRSVLRPSPRDCVLGESRRALLGRFRADRVPFDPSNETACPIIGTQAFLREQATGFTAYRTRDLAKMEAAGGYEW